MIILILLIPLAIAYCTWLWWKKFNKFNRETAAKWGFKPIGFGYIVAALLAAFPLALACIMFMGAGGGGTDQYSTLACFGDGLLGTALAALWLSPWATLLFFQTKAKSDEATAWEAVRMLVLTAVGAGAAIFGLILTKVLLKEHFADKALDSNAGTTGQSFGQMGLGDKRDEVVYFRR